MENITRCICPLSGTYVVMLTKKQPNVSGINLMCTRVENALDLWPLALFSNFMTFIFISFTLNLALHSRSCCCSCWQILLSIHILHTYIFLVRPCEGAGFYFWANLRQILSGLLFALLPQSAHSHAPQRPIFVIVSCACCLLQCGSAFLILLPIWCNRKCAVTFLKMQFCISTSSVMLIYLLGFMKMLPVVSVEFN